MPRHVCCSHRQLRFRATASGRSRQSLQPKRPSTCPAIPFRSQARQKLRSGSRPRNVFHRGPAASAEEVPRSSPWCPGLQTVDDLARKRQEALLLANCLGEDETGAPPRALDSELLTERHRARGVSCAAPRSCTTLARLVPLVARSARLRRSSFSSQHFSSPPRVIACDSAPVVTPFPSEKSTPVPVLRRGLALLTCRSPVVAAAACLEAAVKVATTMVRIPANRKLQQAIKMATRSQK